MDPLAGATDAFNQHWQQFKGHENPPWCLIGRVLSQVKAQQAQVILVAPVWRGQPWYPVLLGMPYNYTRQLPCLLSLFQQTSSAGQMDLLPN